MAPPLRFLAAAALVAVTLATSSSIAAAVSSAPARSSSKKSKSNNCPNADKCGLATDADIARVDSNIDFLFAYQTRLFTGWKGRAIVGETKCFSLQCSLGGCPDDVKTSCGFDTKVTPPSLALIVTCPPAFTIAQSTTCSAVTLDADNVAVKFVPLVVVGPIGDFGGCEAAMDGLADGTVVEIHTAVVCTGYFPSISGAKAGGGAIVPVTDPASLVANAAAVRAAADLFLKRGE